MRHVLSNKGLTLSGSLTTPNQEQPVGLGDKFKLENVVYVYLCA